MALAKGPAASPTNPTGNGDPVQSHNSRQKTPHSARKESAKRLKKHHQQEQQQHQHGGAKTPQGKKVRLELVVVTIKYQQVGRCKMNNSLRKAIQKILLAGSTAAFAGWRLSRLRTAEPTSRPRPSAGLFLA